MVGDAALDEEVEDEEEGDPPVLLGMQMAEDMSWGKTLELERTTERSGSEGVGLFLLLRCLLDGGGGVLTRRGGGRYRGFEPAVWINGMTIHQLSR